MVLMPSTSDRGIADTSETFPRWGVDMDFVTCLLMGVGVKERRCDCRREGVTVPEPPTFSQGAE